MSPSGLPIIRTSVDHGTALDLAGTGLANCGQSEYGNSLCVVYDPECVVRDQGECGMMRRLALQDFDTGLFMNHSTPPVFQQKHKARKALWPELPA